MNEESQLDQYDVKDCGHNFAEIFKSNSDKVKHEGDDFHKVLAFGNYNELFTTVININFCITNSPKALRFKTTIIPHDFVVRNLGTAQLDDSSAPTLLTGINQLYSTKGLKWHHP